MDGDGEKKMESSSTFSSLREETKKKNLEMRASVAGLKTLLHPSLHSFLPTVPTQSCRTKRGEKGRLKHLAGGLQSEASGLLAPSTIISVINSVSLHSFVSILRFGSPSVSRGTWKMLFHSLRFISENTVHEGRFIESVYKSVIVDRAVKWWHDGMISVSL